MKSIYVIIIVALFAGILIKFPGETEKAAENEQIYFSHLKRKLTEGVYRGTGEGFAGPIEVKVTFSRENSTSPVKLTYIEVINHGEIEKYWNIVEDKMLAGMTEKELPGIDAVTGATKSAKGLLEAIEDAKEKSYRRNKSNTIR